MDYILEVQGRLQSLKVAHSGLEKQLSMYEDELKVLTRQYQEVNHAWEASTRASEDATTQVRCSFTCMRRQCFELHNCLLGALG